MYRRELENLAATHIAALWRGYRVRKVFSDIEKYVKNWDLLEWKNTFFMEEVLQNPEYKHIVSAWEGALRKADERLYRESKVVSEADDYDWDLHDEKYAWYEEMQSREMDRDSFFNLGSGYFDY